MRNRTLILGLVVTAMLASSGVAFAQSETDRLREALRQAIAQTRALEDERTALQGKLSGAERDKANLKAQVEAAQAETKKAQKEYRDAVEEFNNRLTEHEATLEKWKSAYEEAATVARTKDAERAKFESEATACEAGIKSCRAKNVALVKIDRQLLRRNSNITFGEKFVAREPLIAYGRVKVQNDLQDYTDKILDQKETACAK
jgi:chromosome segregation ATPase